MPDTTPVPDTEIIGIDKQLSTGEGTVYRGAPNLGTCGGPAESPQLSSTLGQTPGYQGETPPGE